MKTTISLGSRAIKYLSSLDDRMVEALQRGDIRFLRSAWVTQQPDTYRLQCRQELEEFDCQGAKSALMTPKEAVTLVRKGNRGAGSLTHGVLIVRIDSTALLARFHLARSS